MKLGTVKGLKTFLMSKNQTSFYTVSQILKNSEKNEQILSKKK